MASELNDTFMQVQDLVLATYVKTALYGACQLHLSRGSSWFQCTVLGVLHFSHAEFAEVPESMMVEIGGEPAVFRCRHVSVEAIIGWRVNGSSPAHFPDIELSTIRENGVIVYTLSIPASSEYNETEVIGEAFFRNGSLPESTPPATLILTGI